jgi:phenylacetate-CoA ligase
VYFGARDGFLDDYGSTISKKLQLTEVVVYVSFQSLFDLYTLRRNLHSSPSELREMQTKKLRAIIEHAYRNVPFYRRKFDDARVKPHDIKTIKDLTKIPISTKSEIQSASLSEVVAENMDLSKCVKRTTSGSTGTPLTVVVDSRAANFEDAVWTRTYLENGLTFQDKMAVLHDPRSRRVSRSVDLVQHFGIMRRKYISIFDDVGQQSRLIEEYRPQSIKGYASSLAILADYGKQKSAHIHPRLIFSGAELLDKQTRKFISSAFEAEVFDNYACHEFSLMAWECREHMGYHTNVDSVIIEFLDDGQAVSPGEHGEIVCTGLANRAMPLIRYRLGDVGIPEQEQCSCGRPLPLLKIIEGRTDDFLVTLDDKLISPLIFFPYPFKDFEGIKQFRVIQEKRDRLIIQLVLEEGYRSGSEIFEKARIEISRLFGAAMQVEFQTLDKIEKDPSGKLRKIISHVPISGRMNRTV